MVPPCWAVVTRRFEVAGLAVARVRFVGDRFAPPTPPLYPLRKPCRRPVRPAGGRRQQQATANVKNRVGVVAHSAIVGKEIAGLAARKRRGRPAMLRKNFLLR